VLDDLDRLVSEELVSYQRSQIADTPFESCESKRLTTKGSAFFLPLGLVLEIACLLF
jgi:hypothetical protein